MPEKSTRPAQAEARVANEGRITRGTVYEASQALAMLDDVNVSADGKEAATEAVMRFLEMAENSTEELPPEVQEIVDRALSLLQPR